MNALIATQTVRKANVSHFAKTVVVSNGNALLTTIPAGYVKNSWKATNSKIFVKATMAKPVFTRMMCTTLMSTLTSA